MELRGIEPLTSAVRLQFPQLDSVGGHLLLIDKTLSYNGLILLGLDFDCSCLPAHGSYVVATRASYQPAPRHDHNQVNSRDSAL